MSPKIYKIIVIVITVLFIFSIYSVFTSTSISSGGDSDSLSSVNVSSDLGGDFLAQLVQFRSLELKGDIFTSSAFKKLQDFSVELKTQPYGRENPFFATSASDIVLSTEGNSSEN